MTAPGAPPTERTRPNTADSTQATERNYLLLVSVTGSLIVLVFALLTWLDLSRLSDQEFQQRRMIAQVVADANDSMLTSALWDFNMVTLGSILDQMVTHPDVRYVSVRYPSGEIVAERGNGTDLISRVKITQSLSAELDGDPTEIGDLQVVLEDDEAYQQRITNVLVERLIWLLLILLITLMAIHISRRQLAGPLADLRESVAKLVQGQHDTKIPFQKVPGEIGATARVVHNLYTNTQNLYDLQERLVKGMTAKSQEVREVKHNVAELSRNNSLFLASVGQEIRAPLTAIRGAVSLCKNGMAGDLQTRTLELLKIAEDNCRRLEKIVQEVMDIYELQAGILEVECQEVELPSLIQRVIRHWQPAAVQKNQRIHFDTFLNAPHVLADSIRLEQVLDNVVSNAVRYCGNGCEIQISLQVFPETVRITVADNGPGIPAPLRPHLFDILSTEKEAICRHHGRGVGLGLAKGILETMGGHLFYESMSKESINDPALTTGTTFFVDLPLYTGSRVGQPQG